MRAHLGFSIATLALLASCGSDADEGGSPLTPSAGVPCRKNLDVHGEVVISCDDGTRVSLGAGTDAGLVSGTPPATVTPAAPVLDAAVREGLDVGAPGPFGTNAQSGDAGTARPSVGGAAAICASSQYKFIDYADGTVLDCQPATLGRVWQQGSGAGSTWDAAKSYCAALMLGGGGWRMPTINELSMLVTIPVNLGGAARPATYTTYFPSTPLVAFWSSTLRDGTTDQVWAVHFEQGDTRPLPISGTARVRCIR